MEKAPNRGHEASPQSGLGVGCKLCSSSKKLRGLTARAQARRISMPMLFSVLGVSSFLSSPRSAMGRGAWEVEGEFGLLGAVAEPSEVL